MAKNIKGTLTEQNLLKAFAGECQAKNRYEFFAEKARKEGYQSMAAIFDKTALQEQSHAKQFFKFLIGDQVEVTVAYNTDQVGSTLENLKIACEEERNEYISLYPQFAAIAREEGFPAIAAIFTIIAKIEVEHCKRFNKLLAKLESGKLYQSDHPVRWECGKCGYIHVGTQPPQICPGCNHPTGYFEELPD